MQILSEPLSRARSGPTDKQEKRVRPLRGRDRGRPGGVGQRVGAGETIALSGEMPEHTASRAMQDFQTISAHGDTLQAHWSMPLVVAALLSRGEPSVFPRLLPKWEGILSEILQSFCPAARIDTSKESISISPPLGGLSEFQGYEPFDICYPTQRANEEK